MTERPLFIVDPGESDTPETNVNKSIKSRKITLSKTYDSTGKFQVSNKSRLLPHDLKHCHHKRELNLSGKSLDPSTLFSLIRSHGHDLEKLDLSGCDLRYLEEEYFERLSGLEELNLSNNPLRHLDLEFFKHMQHSLKKLDLSGCDLRRLDLRCLECLSGLEELNLSNNPLRHLDLEFLEHMQHSLKKLDLSGCDLEYVDWRCLEHLSGLEELNLSNNPLHHLDLKFFKHMQYSLKKLHLSGCDLHCLDWRCLKHLSGLRKLMHLSGCDLTSQHLEDLTYLRGLEDLNLSNNPLHSIKLFSFKSMPGLRTLDISGCGLADKDLKDFALWDGVEELNLSNNPLSHMLRYPKNLRKLNLSGCCLTKWPSGLEECSRLEQLDLSNNSFGHQLENFPPSVSGLSNLNRIMLEDAVYMKDDKVWTVEKRKDVSSACSAFPSTISISGRLPQMWHHGLWERTIEFRETRNLKTLTFETYNSMCFSLQIVCHLVSSNVPEYFVERTYTAKECLSEIFRRLGQIDLQSSLVHESVVRLKRYLSCLISYYFLDDVEYKSEVSHDNASEVFLNKSSPIADRVLAVKLVIMIKILQNLTKPEDAVLHSLHWLQKLHEVYSLLVNETETTFPASGELFKFTECVLGMDKILFQFVQMFSKQPPTDQDWPCTIKLGDQIYNPLINEQYLKQRLTDGDKAASSIKLDMEVEFDDPVTLLEDPLSRLEEHSIPIIEASRGSITANEMAGCVHVPVASAFLVVPRGAFWCTTLRCSRVKYSDCKVKPREGEYFVSRILKVEPEGVVFYEPVTVLLSHSLYEDQDFLDFYELVIENVGPAGLQELKTERISSIEDIPKQIRNPELLVDYLPMVKATIHGSRTLVAATRVRSHQIFIPTNRRYTFFKQYGKNTQLNITFPAGVTKEIQSLNVQVFPADAVLNKDVHLDKNLVCAPVIKVSGQTTPFLEAVHVELTYSNSDILNIEEEFLPVGSKTNFTTKYGLLLRSQKETPSTSKHQALNESNNVFIKRPRKDQLKFSFSLKHFCKISPIAKKTDSAQLPNVEDNNVVNQSLSHNRRFLAIALAMHCLGKKTLYAVLAPTTAQGELKEKWKVAGLRLGPRLKSGQQIFVCVPLDKDTTHLPLEDCVLWFDHEMEFELPNKTSEDVHLEGRFMYFLSTECTGKNHNVGKDGCGKVEIHNFEENPDKNKKPANEEAWSTIAQIKEGSVSSAEGITSNGHATSQKKVMKSILSCCEYFENEIENKCLEKLGINKNEIQNPNNGVTAKVLNDAGSVTSIMLGLGVGVTLALSIGSFGIGSIVGATVAGVTFTVTKIDKKIKKSTAKKLDKKVEIYFHSHLRCIIMDTAKELSRMFEYQVLTLKDGSQIDILAQCAVNLMLDLKKDDKFDRNTLLKKVLQDGKIDKTKLVTTNDDKWFAPDVFRKPGLQRTVVEMHRAVFIYQVKPDHSCDPINYGYRGQFLEAREYGSQNKENDGVNVPRYRKAPATNQTRTCEDPCKELCKECSSNFESCTSGEYFVESDIDLQYTKAQDVFLTYHPIHILVQCPKILQSFKQLREGKPSFANFLKKKFELPEDHLVHPVYRQHSPGKVPDLTKSDLSGSDFSHSNFTNSFLENCDFTKCVMLFTQLPGAKISGSKFCETLISHSNLTAVQADHCTWTKTSLLSSRVDGAHLDSSIGGNCLYETNLSDAIIGKREINRNETTV